MKIKLLAVIGAICCGGMHIASFPIGISESIYGTQAEETQIAKESIIKSLIKFQINHADRNGIVLIVSSTDKSGEQQNFYLNKVEDKLILCDYPYDEIAEQSLEMILKNCSLVCIESYEMKIDTMYEARIEQSKFILRSADEIMCVLLSEKMQLSLYAGELISKLESDFDSSIQNEGDTDSESHSETDIGENDLGLSLTVENQANLESMEIIINTSDNKIEESADESVSENGQTEDVEFETLQDMHSKNQFTKRITEFIKQNIKKIQYTGGFIVLGMVILFLISVIRKNKKRRKRNKIQKEKCSVKESYTCTEKNTANDEVQEDNKDNKIEEGAETENNTADESELVKCEEDILAFYFTEDPVKQYHCKMCKLDIARIEENKRNRIEYEKPYLLNYTEEDAVFMIDSNQKVWINPNLIRDSKNMNLRLKEAQFRIKSMGIVYDLYDVKTNQEMSLVRNKIYVIEKIEPAWITNRSASQAEITKKRQAICGRMT